MDILYQFNNRYAPYAGVSIISLFENNKTAGDITVHVFDDNSDPISPENLQKFKELEYEYKRKIVIYNTDRLVEEIRELDIPTYRGSYAANMRMFFDELIDLKETKLLYLDADTIVDGDISELFDTALGDRAIGMVLESQGNVVRKSIGLASEYGYYNSGVILYDVNQWKAHNCRNRIVEHAKSIRSQYISPDQDLINLALCDEIKCLDLRYNFQPMHQAYSLKAYFRTYHVRPYYSYDEIMDAKKEVKIYHCYRFINEFPWHKGNLHPFNEMFDKYLSISPWKDYEKRISNHSIITRIEKEMYTVLPKCIFLSIFKWVRDIVVCLDERKLKE